jgi:acyl dehydratase
MSPIVVLAPLVSWDGGKITQEQVDLFAEATGDHQWTHIDPERARSGPFGRTVALTGLERSPSPLRGG